jgi:quercetin dioxygenase-like cupin family protein
MKHSLLLLLFCPLFAGSPSTFMVWKANDLKSKSQTEDLVKAANYRPFVVHRDKNGEAEIHENHDELFLILTGEATLIAGGSAVDVHTVSPGEIHGPSIKGGESTALVPGDLVSMRASIPHQWMVAPGKQVTYLCVKLAK